MMSEKRGTVWLTQSQLLKKVSIIEKMGWIVKVVMKTCPIS